MLTEFERKAWDSRSIADRHSPIMAAKAAVDQIERGEFVAVQHVVVLVIERHQCGGSQINILQAGELSELEVEGALHRAMHLQAQRD